jgi:hypothetical protein
VVPGRVNGQSASRSPLAAAVRPPLIAVAWIAPQPHRKRCATGRSCRHVSWVGSPTKAPGGPGFSDFGFRVGLTVFPVPSASAFLAPQRKENHP